MKFIPLIVMLSSILLDARNITFAELKDSALLHSDRLSLRLIDTKIEEARLGSVYSTLYPQLSLGYSGEYNRNLDDTSSESISVGDTTINSSVPYEHSVALKLNYELYHFGSTLKQLEMLNKEVAVKKLDNCSEEIKIYQELLDNYVRAQKAQSEKAFKSQMQILRVELYIIKQRLYSAGRESRISVGDEAIRLIDIERDIKNAQLEFEESVIALSKLSYIDLSTSDTNLMALDANTFINKILQFSDTPQALTYKEKILQKNAEISMLKRNQLPVISLYSNYYLYGSDAHNTYDGFNDLSPNSWNAGLSLRWNLFEGFKYNSESSRLRLELERLRKESELSKREFDYETRTSQEKLESLSLLKQNQAEALDEARHKLVMTQRLRSQGEVDAASEVSVKLEVLERELTLENENIQHAYESEKLRLQHMEAAQCTQH